MYAGERRASKRQRKHSIFELCKFKLLFAVPVAVDRIDLFPNNEIARERCECTKLKKLSPYGRGGGRAGTNIFRNWRSLEGSLLKDKAGVAQAMSNF